MKKYIPFLLFFFSYTCSKAQVLSIGITSGFSQFHSNMLFDDFTASRDLSIWDNELFLKWQPRASHFSVGFQFGKFREHQYGSGMAFDNGQPQNTYKVNITDDIDNAQYELLLQYQFASFFAKRLSFYGGVTLTALVEKDLRNAVLINVADTSRAVQGITTNKNTWPYIGPFISVDYNLQNIVHIFLTGKFRYSVSDNPIASAGPFIPFERAPNSYATIQLGVCYSFDLHHLHH